MWTSKGKVVVGGLNSKDLEISLVLFVVVDLIVVGCFVVGCFVAGIA